MLFKASEEYFFRLDKTLFIGDDTRDCQTARNAGCQSIFIGNQKELSSLNDDELPMYSSHSMLDAVDIISDYYSL